MKSSVSARLFCRKAAISTPVHGVEGGVHAAQGNDRLGSAEKSLDARVGPEIAVEGKGRRMAPPARQWLLRGGLMGFRDGDKGRRSRAAIEIFVGAADREIDGMQRSKPISTTPAE